MNRFLFNCFAIVFCVFAVSVKAAPETCTLEATRLDFNFTDGVCARPADPNLCTTCPLRIIQTIVSAGYSVEEINAMPIERCLVENLSLLLDKGATLLALLSLQACDFDSGDLASSILAEVTFPPPFPGLPTEWLRNGNETPSSPEQPRTAAETTATAAPTPTTTTTTTTTTTNAKEADEEEEEKSEVSALSGPFDAELDSVDDNFPSDEATKEGGLATTSSSARRSMIASVVFAVIGSVFTIAL